MKRFIGVLLAVCCLWSCTEEIDTSARYVFKDETICSYLQKYPEHYSEYSEMCKKVRVSKRSESTVMQLLSARGHYTVFAPSNDAIHAYLESLVEEDVIASPSWDAFTDSLVLDSIRKVIVYNSIIDSHDEAAYDISSFPQESNSLFAHTNMKDIKLSVLYPGNPDSIYINYNCPVNVRNRDIRLLNGYLHQMEKVIAPSEQSMAGMLNEYVLGLRTGFGVMARLCEACGLMDTLSKLRDEVYESLYENGLIEEQTPANGLADMTGGYSYAPEHRKYGFTIFAEPDSWWEEQLGKPASAITLDDVQDWVSAQGYYPDALANSEYDTPSNLLYQWTTYHVLPFKMSPDRLVFHFNEFGYDYRDRSMTLGMAVTEMYTTLGKRRLVKIYESAESNGVYLNRFPKLDTRRSGNGHEIGCDPDKVGCRVYKDDPTLQNHQAVNGYLYSIDAPLVYSDAVRENMGRSRMRTDCMSWFPEAMNNDICRVPLSDAPHQWVHFPDDTQYRYIENLSINEGSTFVYYNAYGKNYGSLRADEVKCVGRWSLVFKLPPVPRLGVYEVRYRVLTNSDRGVAQLYFGDDPEHLPVTGIPLDLTQGGANSITGWSEDIPGDDEYNAEVDKQMRNNGFMKGEQSIRIFKQGGSPARDNVNRNIIRRILTRQTLDPDKTYYLKIKSVLDRTTAEFYMDGIEYCPKEVYDNPVTPEDIW